jgi:hypothetical protein
MKKKKKEIKNKKKKKTFRLLFNEANILNWPSKATLSFGF